MAQRGRRTIADVARAAGVSTATVSRVLNGGSVSAAAREAVLDAVARLRYRRNDLARGLVTGHTGVVGVLIPDVIGPLYAQMARGIEDVLEPRGMHYMMVTDDRDLLQEEAAIELLLARQVDALVLIGSRLAGTRLRALVGEETPTVLVQREWEGEEGGFGVVEIDNAAAVDGAVARLLELGHERIAHVAGQRRDAALRERAFRTALERRGLEPGPVIASDSTEAGGARAAEELVGHLAHDGTPPAITAVACSNDRLAAGLYRALRERGLRVPDDVSVTGFDDLPWSAYLDPPLTTIRQPARAMGRAAATQVLATLGRRAAPERTTVATELVWRDSVLDLRQRPGRASPAPAREVSAH